jgi:hypothetical protein
MSQVTAAAIFSPNLLSTKIFPQTFKFLLRGDSDSSRKQASQKDRSVDNHTLNRVGVGVHIYNLSYLVGRDREDGR